MKRRGWERLSRPRDKCGAHWEHWSGWAVRHCGHPTANWPYYLVDPAHPEVCTVSFNGRGFRTLAAAMIVAERVASGSFVATDERCGPQTRRVMCDAAGDPLAEWQLKEDQR